MSRVGARSVDNGPAFEQRRTSSTVAGASLTLLRPRLSAAHTHLSGDFGVGVTLQRQAMRT